MKEELGEEQALHGQAGEKVWQPTLLIWEHEQEKGRLQ